MREKSIPILNCLQIVHKPPGHATDLPHQHCDEIVSVHCEHCHVEKNEIEFARLPTKCGCDCRTYEKWDCHILAHYYPNRTYGVYDCGDVSDIKFIRAVKVEEFNHYITPHILQIINTINPTISKKQKMEKNIVGLCLYSFA
jgi:hypothetical protein